MGKKVLSGLLLALYTGLVAADCLDGNCTSTEEQAVPVRLQISVGSFLPFFGPVDINDERNHFDEAIDPRLPVKTSSETLDSSSDESSESPEDTPEVSVNVLEMFTFTKVSKDLPEPDTDLFPLMLRSIMGAEILDLSGMSLTGDELEKRLVLRLLLGKPVSSLILSNSRIQNLTTLSFQPVQDYLRELRMDNCSANLDALANLSNLKFLNLSSNGLSTFEWFSKLSDTLEVLDLSHNAYAEVRPELSILTSLRELYLSHNKIGSVKEFPLSLLPNLEVVSLTMNSLFDATFTELLNLQQLDVDWNYLRRVGYELQLPVHRVSLKLASNPWRCDCSLLEARDSNDILDIDQLQCANDQSYAICEDCRRYFLPLENGKFVNNETKDSIERLGCTGLSDQLYLLRGALVELRDKEPEKLFALGMMVLGGLLLLVLSILTCRTCYLRKKFDRKAWLKMQIPYLKVNQLSKPQEVPYIKI